MGNPSINGAGNRVAHMLLGSSPCAAVFSPKLLYHQRRGQQKWHGNHVFGTARYWCRVVPMSPSGHFLRRCFRLTYLSFPNLLSNLFKIRCFAASLARRISSPSWKATVVFVRGSYPRERGRSAEKSSPKGRSTRTSAGMANLAVTPATLAAFVYCPWSCYCCRMRHLCCRLCPAVLKQLSFSDRR